MELHKQNIAKDVELEEVKQVSAAVPKNTELKQSSKEQGSSDKEVSANQTVQEQTLTSFIDGYLKND